MMAAPQLLQRPLMLATKLSSSSLPSAAPIHQVRILNGQPCRESSNTLTGIVIATPPMMTTTTTRLANSALLTPVLTPILTPALKPAPNKPIQISSLNAEPKTVKPGGGSEQKLVVSPPPSTPPLSLPAKREDNPEVCRGGGQLGPPAERCDGKSCDRAVVPFIAQH
ncbi:PHD finger protein 21A isoform X2 [Notothenia coriiceps]|uniref:PHD finger protein 21A isoform X2 n=1 Tax=Notothenia coriiceps TaxID=8208 RepID=A0A6I9N9J7_9TELE|nr:PREDICTED: PHD finger protein 21A isoform X2 [Notothenia coriiceps]